MEAHAREQVPAEVGGEAAAREALQWAEALAGKEDYALAVKWLDRAEELLGGLSRTYRKRRRDWQRAAKRTAEL
jgi:hypothetical protein